MFSLNSILIEDIGRDGGGIIEGCHFAHAQSCTPDATYPRAAESMSTSELAKFTLEQWRVLFEKHDVDASGALDVRVSNISCEAVMILIICFGGNLRTPRRVERWGQQPAFRAAHRTGNRESSERLRVH